jgi:hypothetical protein
MPRIMKADVRPVRDLEGYWGFLEQSGPETGPHNTRVKGNFLQKDNGVALIVLELVTGCEGVCAFSASHVRALLVLFSCLMGNLA